MKQTIEIPDGKKAVWKDNKVVFEDIKSQLPKTWEEFCKQNKMKKNECYIDNTSYPREAYIGERLKNIDRNVLPNEQAAEQHLALMQLHQLRDYYRQDWKPDWKNTKTDKYCIVNGEGLFITSYTTYVRFLSFQSIEIAR